MSIKLVVLKSGEQLIADVKEIVSEEKVCAYLLENPHSITLNRTQQFLSEEENSQVSDVMISMTPWICLSSAKNIPLNPDWVVTVVQPVDDVLNMYEEQLNGQEHSVHFTEE